MTASTGNPSAADYVLTSSLHDLPERTGSREGGLRRFLGYDHVLLHRLWTFATLQNDLSLLERSHIHDCEQCRLALQKCFKAEHFGTVLVELQREDNGPSAKARKYSLIPVFRSIESERSPDSHPNYRRSKEFSSD